MINEEIRRAWDIASYEARRGNNKPLAAFLRERKHLYPDVDLFRLGQLLEGGFPSSRRGPRSKAVKETRAADPFFKADDGDPWDLIDSLEPHFLLCTVPDLELVVEVVLGFWDSPPGPKPRHALSHSLQASSVVTLVRQVRARGARNGKLLPLDEAFHIVGKEVFKSEDWVRTKYYKRQRNAPASTESWGEDDDDSTIEVPN